MAKVTLLGGSDLGTGMASNIDHLRVSKITEDQLDLTNTHAAINDLRDKVLTLVVLKQVPDRRLIAMKARWIVAFLKGKNRRFVIASELLNLHGTDEGALRVVHRPPSGVPQVPVFTVMHDLYPDHDNAKAEDPELFIASRIETIASISQIIGHGVVDTIKLIEGSASPLEQLARQAE